MLSGTVEPECRQRRRPILFGTADALDGADATAAPRVEALSSADDAPVRQATKTLAHAIIHAAVNGVGTTGRELFPTAALSTVGASSTGLTRLQLFRGVA